MYKFDVETTLGKNTTVHLLHFCVLLLLGTGLVTLYSSSYFFADKFFFDGNYFIKKQLMFGAAGLAAFFIFSRLNLNILRKFILPFIIIAAVLCVLTRVPGIGVERYGASRWIEVGIVSYQPSEMVKFTLPLYIAHLLDKKSGNLSNFSSVTPPILITGFFCGLICLQNNFSTAVFILLNAMIIFYLAGIRYRHFLTIVAVIIPIAALLVFLKEHRVKRLISFLRPEWDPTGAGYQINASRDAIVSSGFFGKGIGEGTRKLASIPEIHSDFIFSSYVEETGFIGILLFIAMITVFAVLGYKAALNSQTVFKRLLAAGLTTVIVSQSMVNIAVVSGALPATGIPLPFFSAGGSSLLTTLICAGLITNVARNGAADSAAEESVYEMENSYEH